MKNKKKIVIKENYLKKVPMRAEGLEWTSTENGDIILLVENKGWANRLAQAVFKRPRVSKIHLDKMGNFIWPILDGKKDIITIGEAVKERFGQKAEPLYERLARYFQIMESYHFIEWKRDGEK